MSQLERRVMILEDTLRRLQFPECQKYKGLSAIDFTTTTLPHHGDYGFQTTANELQMNCNGTIRSTAMSTL